MQNTYGVLGKDGNHIDVSKTEKGAKNYASRHGYTKVSIRLNGGYNAVVISEKKGKRWYNLKNNYTI